VYTVGEGGVIPFSKMQDYIDEDRNELKTLYHDEIGNIWGRDSFDVGDYKVGRNNVVGVKEIVGKWDEKFLTKGWNTVFFTNHDQSRAVSRYGNDAPEYRDASAKMLYTFLLTQRATPYIYNGDEIGMTNIRFKNVEQYNDLQTRNRYYLALKESKEAAAAYLQMQAELSRDNSRTPMQWDGAANAGFTSGKPWLPINENYTNTNVKAEDTAANSVLNFVRRMIKLRKDNKDVLVYGKYTLLDKTNPGVYSYTREMNGRKLLVLINFTKNTSAYTTGLDISKAKILISNYTVVSLPGTLKPYEIAVYEL